MKKITKKILSVVMVVSLLICSSMALSLGAYAADDVVFSDSFGVEYRGDILYGVPGEEIDLTPVLSDNPDYFVGAMSLDYGVVEDVWDDEGMELLALNAVDNGVALINVWYAEGDEIVDDFYALVVVSDGTDLGSVSSIEVEDVVMGYDEEIYISPSVYSDSEDVYYCSVFSCEDWDAPFSLWSDGNCYAYESGSGEAVCYVIDAQGDVFTDTFEIEVEEPSLFVTILQYISWFIEILLMIFG
ncbi:MAG: hypothetical protein IJZ57_07195 [Clostridia bacterium]|nr:hypothetical protein [Clostridia bacterium]